MSGRNGEVLPESVVAPAASAPLPDDVLAERIARDTSAFVTLYDRFYARIYNYLRYRCGDPAVTDDLTAQTFERAWAGKHSYRPDRGPFSAWLFAIARNAANDHLRRRWRRPVVSYEALGERASDVTGPEQQLIQDETLAELLAALEDLEERPRDLLALKFGARLTNRQIAELTGLSDSNVGVILFRALARLRDALAHKEQDYG